MIIGLREVGISFQEIGSRTDKNTSTILLVWSDSSPTRLSIADELLRVLHTEILYIDEANFSTNTVQSLHIKHIWAEENPCAILKSGLHGQFSGNVWVEIFDNLLIGRFFLHDGLNRENIRQFLGKVPDLMEDVPILVRNRLCFMHDVAPWHSSVLAQKNFNQNYNNPWIDRVGPQIRPHTV